MKILEALLEYNGGDWVATCEDVNALQEVLRKVSPNALMDTWEDMCIDNDKCWCCGGDVEYETVREERGEYWGIPSYEDVTYAVCVECGNRS